MASEQLVDYIRSQLKVGVTKADLQKAIADAGWTSADAQAAFDVVEGKVPVMPQPKPMQPLPPVQSQPLQPMQPRPSSPGMPVFTPTRSPRRRHKYLPWLIALLAFVIVIGAIILYVPTVRTIAQWYLEGMPAAPSTNALVPVQETSATTTEQTSTSTNATATSTATSTPTNIIISTSTATSTH